MYLGFILIRYGKTHRHRNDCHGGRSLYSRSPETRAGEYVLGMGKIKERAGAVGPGLAGWYLSDALTKKSFTGSRY